MIPEDAVFWLRFLYKIKMKEFAMYFINMIKNKKFIRYFLLYSLIFTSSFVIFTIVGLKNASLSDGTIYFVSNYTSLRYDIGGMAGILANNFIISITILYYFYYAETDRFKKFVGKFQFAYLGAISGLVVSKAITKYNLIIALGAIVPHGIIEIPAIIFAISSGWVLSESRDTFQSKIPKELIYASVTLFIMLSISAYIENYVTPNIFKMLISYYHIT